MHFQETGRAVTNLIYYAWSVGPVPVSLLDDMMQSVPPAHLAKLESDLIDLAACPHLSKRELRLLAGIADLLEPLPPLSIPEIDCLDCAPWHASMSDPSSRYKPIAYSLALSPLPADRRQAVEDVIAERQALFTPFNERLAP